MTTKKNDTTAKDDTSEKEAPRAETRVVFVNEDVKGALLTLLSHNLSDQDVVHSLAWARQHLQSIGNAAIQEVLNEHS